MMASLQASNPREKSASTHVKLTMSEPSSSHGGVVKAWLHLFLRSSSMWPSGDSAAALAHAGDRGSGTGSGSAAGCGRGCCFGCACACCAARCAAFCRHRHCAGGSH